MTLPIGTAEERELIERLQREDHIPTFNDSLRWALANPDGPEAATALQSRIAEVEALLERVGVLEKEPHNLWLQWKAGEISAEKAMDAIFDIVCPPLTQGGE